MCVIARAAPPSTRLHSLRGAGSASTPAVFVDHIYNTSALFQCPCPFGSYSHVPAALSESSGKHVVTHLPEINLRESNSATDMERPRVPALGVTATSGHVRTRKCSDRATTTVLSTTVLSTTVLWPLTRCTYLRCHYTMNAAQ